MQTPASHVSPAPAPAPAEQSNGLAIAAFVISLVGLVGTGGILCPVGLILGLIALGKPGGRGFSIAAIILGLIGSCGVIFAVGIAIIFGIGLLVAFFAFVIGAAGSAENVGVAVDMATVAAEVSEYRQRTGGYPERLEDIAVDQEHLVDPWGGRLVYEPTGEQLGFDLVSAGPDGTPDTADDIRLSELGALFGFPDARIEIEGGAGSGGITRITAGELEITIDAGTDGGPERFVVKRGDMTIFEASDNQVRMGSDLGSDEAAPPSAPAPPAAPAPARVPDAELPPGSSEDVPLGGSGGNTSRGGEDA